MGIVCRFQITIKSHLRNMDVSASAMNVKRMNEQRDLYKSEWRRLCAFIILIMLYLLPCPLF